MATHDNHDALVDYDYYNVSSRETEGCALTVVKKSPTRSGTNEDGEGNEAKLRQEHAVREPDHADVDMPIGDLIDVFMYTFAGRVYADPEQTDAIWAAVEDGEIEESYRCSKNNTMAYA